jgi:hypothetical protein
MKHYSTLRKSSVVRHQAGPQQPSHGVALVLTLLVVAMLTVVLVSFNAITRTEQAAARNYTKHAVGYRVAAAGEQQAIALLQNTLTNTNNLIVTQPGRAIYWDNNGAQQIVELSSASIGSGSSGDATLNFKVTSGTATNWSAISSNNSPSYFSAPWVNITDNAGQLVGRYAFWIDDNGSRLNLNFATTNARSSFYPTNARPLNAMRLDFGPPATASGNIVAFTNNLRGLPAALSYVGAPSMTTNRSPHTPTWGYFLLPEQIRSFGATNTNQANNRTTAQRLFNTLQWQIGAGPGNFTNLGSPPNVFGRQPLVAGFLGFDGGSMSAMNSFIASRLNGPRLRERFGELTFDGKYTANALRQILANVNDLTRGSDGIAYGAGLLNPDENVPNSFAALRPYPHLNEVVARPYLAVAPDNGRIEVQVYLGVELLNPYPSPLGDNARLFFDLERLDFTGTYERNGVTNNFAGGTNPWPRTGIYQATPIIVDGDIPPKSYRTNNLFYRWEWSVNTPPPADGPTVISNINMTVNFQLRTVQLSQSAEPETMRDWAVSTDLPLWSFSLSSANAGDSNSTFVGFGQTGPLLNLPGVTTVSDVGAQGVAKNDPRVRTFPGWRNEPDVTSWTPVGGAGPAITFGGNNSVVNFTVGTGTPSNLPNDAAPADNIALDHPSFEVPDRSVATEWLSAFELGQVHTGLQWRTLHMHSQNSNEVGVIPDWALLDVFAVTNAYVPVSTRINVNSLPYPAVAQGLQPTNAAAQGLSRAGTYAALIAGFVEANSPNQAQLLSNGTLVNARLSTNSLAVFASNQIGPVATNIATTLFTTTNNWRVRRAALPGFPEGAFGTLAELVEVAGVSDGDLTKAEKEQRGRILYDSMTTYSDVFTVYSVGQAVEVAPGGQLNVLGEARMRTQVRFDPSTGKVVTVVRTPVVTP